MLKTKQKIFLAGLAQSAVMGVRRLFGKGPTTRVRRSQVEWDLDLREGIDFAIWLLGAFEPGTVRRYRDIVREGDVVLDIGANVGAHTLLLAKTVGAGGKVLAFEPTDYALEKLQKNRSLNPDLAGRIECYQYMLVDETAAGTRTPEIYSSWPLGQDGDVHALHRGQLKTTNGAQAQTLDHVIASLGLDKVDFIKLDIDGFECGMMRGADAVLARWHPKIIMELAPYSLAEQGESFAELIGILRKHGYALFDLVTGKALEMDPSRLEQKIPPGSSINAVARA